MTEASNIDVLNLTGGGSVSLVTDGPDGYFLLVARNGLSFSVALSVMDLNGLRALTGDAAMKRAQS